jgi:hypothetical protein
MPRFRQQVVRGHVDLTPTRTEAEFGVVQDRAERLQRMQGETMAELADRNRKIDDLNRWRVKERAILDALRPLMPRVKDLAEAGDEGCVDWSLLLLAAEGLFGETP